MNLNSSVNGRIKFLDFILAEPNNVTDEDDYMKVNCYLYTKNDKNNPKLIDMSNNSEIKLDKSFNKTKPVKFIVHGWLSDFEKPSVQLIKDAFMDINDYNVIGK